MISILPTTPIGAMRVCLSKSPEESMFRCRSFHWCLLLLCLAVRLGIPCVQAEPTAKLLSAEEFTAVKRAEAARIQAIEKVYGSVVAIYGNDRQGGGSGVLYHPAGYALTNHHVVAAAGDEGWAGLADGKLYRWRLLGTDPGGDLAIIRLQGRNDFPTARLGDSDLVRVGDWAMAMGNPFVLAEDQRPTVTLGIVSGVKRYQPGDGLNTLVYGNCLQVDSSINPGNSGGPLFNLRGEVIGINGRCSFEERGRVNVGLGYSISSNQVKHFIPDLLATKTVQHGTLDCQFGNRATGVICQSINLNAPIAQLGLELGDKLIAFEGYEIQHANEFTNLITIYPADWPCEVTFEHAGKQKTVHVRLTALPYDLKSPAPRKPMPPPESPPHNKPADKPPAEKPADDKQPAEQPKSPPAQPEPVPAEVAKKPTVPLQAGKIRFPDLNRESTQLLLQHWKATHVRQTPTALQIVEERWQQQELVSVIETTISDHRFVVNERQGDQLIASSGFNGKTFWRKNDEEKSAELPFEKALRDPLVVQALAMATLWQAQPAATWGELLLEGGDKAQRQIAYRLALQPTEQDPIYLWLSVLNASGTPQLELLKTGIGLRDDEPVMSTTYHDWKEVAGVQWPHRKFFVTGLAETPQQELKTRSVATISANDSLFEMNTP
jgi:S1-C subfamily serine protease